MPVGAWLDGPGPELALEQRDRGAGGLRGVRYRGYRRYFPGQGGSPWICMSATSATVQVRAGFALRSRRSRICSR